MRAGVDSKHARISGRGAVTLLWSGRVTAGRQTCKDLGFEEGRSGQIRRREMSRRGCDIYEGVREGTVTEQVGTATMSLLMAAKPVLENHRGEGGLGGLGHPQGLAGDGVQWVVKEAPWGGGRPKPKETLPG